MNGTAIFYDSGLLFNGDSNFSSFAEQSTNKCILTNKKLIEIKCEMELENKTKEYQKPSKKPRIHIRQIRETEILPCIA